MLVKAKRKYGDYDFSKPERETNFENNNVYKNSAGKYNYRDYLLFKSSLP